jgi:hypothetical protein
MTGISSDYWTKANWNFEPVSSKAAPNAEANDYFTEMEKEFKAAHEQHGIGCGR